MDDARGPNFEAGGTMINEEKKRKVHLLQEKGGQ